MNPHDRWPLPPQDSASANSATPAFLSAELLYQIKSGLSIPILEKNKIFFIHISEGQYFHIMLLMFDYN